MAERKYMTTEDICDLYHVTRRTVYRWKGTGKLSAHKVGKRLLFDPVEVEALIDKGEGKDAQK